VGGAWNKILGHDRLVQIFDRLVARGRLAHAYLFCGPAGVGKRLFARELGKALLCENAGEKLQACGHCPACLQVEAGSHPDFVVAGRPEESNDVPIDTIRELCQGFGLKSARGRGRIAILDDADDLSDISANCFLKTLEEPPPRSLLLLIGTSADRQLPTIRSRCQIVTFAPLGDEQMRAILQKNGITEPAALDRLVRFSQGSPGRALALADDALWEFRKQFLGSLGRGTFDAVGQMRAWMHFINEAGKESAPQRRRAAMLLDLVIEFFRQVLILGSDDSDPDETALARRLATALSTETTLAILERLLLASQQIDRKVQIVLVVEAMLDALAHLLRGLGGINK
jgi:DNA polymerase-3 subunit delta'